jgi:hypothetical protein
MADDTRTDVPGGFGRTDVPGGFGRTAVIANLTGKRRTGKYDVSAYGRVILSTHEGVPALAAGTIELRPFEGVVLAPREMRKLAPGSFS